MTDGNDRPAIDVPAAPGKVDPETLALRAQPARAIRFKRGAIGAIAALGSVTCITKYAFRRQRDRRGSDHRA